MDCYLRADYPSWKHEVLTTLDWGFRMLPYDIVAATDGHTG